MRQLRIVTALSAVLVFVLVTSVFPAAAVVPVPYAGAGIITGGSMYTGSAWSSGECQDNGRPSPYYGIEPWGAPGEDDEGVFRLGMAHQTISSHALPWTLGVLELCGELSRTPGNQVDAALGTQCNFPNLQTLESNRGFYGDGGRGHLTLARSLSGGERVVRIRNLRWAPSLTGTFLAHGDYETDPYNHLAGPMAGTSGTVLLQIQIGWAGATCLALSPPPADIVIGGVIELVPTEL